MNIIIYYYTCFVVDYGVHYISRYYYINVKCSRGLDVNQCMLIVSYSIFEFCHLVIRYMSTTII